MARFVTEEEIEEVYALAETCVERYAEYERWCDLLLEEWSADRNGARPSPRALAGIDKAMAELKKSADALGKKLMPIRRTIHARSAGVVELLDVQEASYVEALQRLARREGERAPWTGRLDLQNEAHRDTLGRAGSIWRSDRLLNNYLSAFEPQRVRAELNIEAGRLVQSVVGEYDHALRALDRQPRMFFELLIEKRGRPVTQEDLIERGVCGEGGSYKARNRLKNALRTAGHAELDERIETVEGGYRLL